MSKKNRKRRRKQDRFFRRSAPGAMPGTVKPQQDSYPTSMHFVAFGGDTVVDKNINTVDELPEVTSGVRWLDVRGLSGIKKLKAIASKFGLHPLAMEDVVNVHQRPKVETYDDHLFIVTRGVERVTEDGVELEQLSIFLGQDFVVTFQERSDDSFGPVRERIQAKRGRICDSGPDYLAYALLDATIDGYFPVVEQFADRIDNLEEVVDGQDGPELLGAIHATRNELLSIRRSIRPQRDAVSELIRLKHPLISEDTRVYLRDCHDHASQLLDFVEVYREMCGGLRDYQMAMLSNRMNEIMKVLTIISTIFIPLSFIAGLYGMNFNTSLRGNMPELNLPFGYVGALGAMTLVAASMLFYFWRNGWIGRR